MSFNDLVRRLQQMENGEEETISKSTTPENMSADKRAIMETANVLKSFDQINEGKSRSAEIVADRDDEQDTQKPITRKAPKPTFDPDEENTIDPVVESPEYNFDNDALVENDDVSAMIRQRFSQFMQGEMRGGADIDTITSAINEGSAQAKMIHSVFMKLTNNLERIRDMTEEGSKLYRAIEAEDGDIKKLMDANKKIDQALGAIRKSHTYATSQNTPE